MNWTFGIITDGFHDDRVKNIINSIEDQKIPNYEIIIIGGNTNLKSNHKIKVHIMDSPKYKWPDDSYVQGHYKKENFSISLKKNLITKLSQYNNICFLHDYIALCDNWYSGWIKYGERFDVVINKIIGNNGHRFNDWITWDHPKYGYTLVPYDKKIQKYMYISGSYFCAKKSIMEQYPLNEKLEWGEAEDVEWSLRTRNKINYSCNYYSEVILIKEKISSHNILSSDNKRFIINSKKLENDFNAGIENNFTISDYASWLNFRLDYAIGKLKRIVKNILIKR